MTGLTSSNNQLWSQESPGIADNAQLGDRFGAALTTGDFDNDGFDDLAIGVPVEHGGVAEPGLGAVHVLYGSSSRLTASRSQFWDQLSPGVLGDGQGWERFGEALAAGDFNGDGRDDLAVGAPSHVVGSAGPCGAVNVLYGAATGLTATGNQLWNEETPGIAEQCDVQARFGLALVAADFNGDNKADLAIGAPWENLLPGSTHNSKGAVHVLFGSQNRLTATGSQFWTQDSPGIPDTAEQGDYFGSSLGAGDFNDDGRADLAIGVPRETIGTILDAGVMHVLYGGATGPTATGNQLWSQDSIGILGTSQNGDWFGSSLSH
jgi:FG-GAP repeat